MSQSAAYFATPRHNALCIFRIPPRRQANHAGSANALLPPIAASNDTRDSLTCSLEMRSTSKKKKTKPLPCPKLVKFKHNPHYAETHSTLILVTETARAREFVSGPDAITQFGNTTWPNRDICSCPTFFCFLAAPLPFLPRRISTLGYPSPVDQSARRFARARTPGGNEAERRLFCLVVAGTLAALCRPATGPVIFQSCLGFFLHSKHSYPPSIKHAAVVSEFTSAKAIT